MQRQVHVRVRLDSGETIEALVLEWLAYPDRALVQLPSRQRPSVVRLNAVTGLYSPRVLPVPSPRLALALAGLVVAGSLLGLLIPPLHPARSAPRAPAAAAARTAPLATALEDTAGELRPPASPVSRGPAPPRLAPPPTRPVPRPALSPAPAATPHDRRALTASGAVAGPSTRTPLSQLRPAAATPNAVRYEARPAVASAGRARRAARVCRCGRTFHSAQELEAHRRGVVYSCIRYPKCQVTSAQPQAILEHYEKDRDTAGRCWREALRLGSSYAVVKRPACRALAADPDRRRVIKVRVRLNTMDDDSPWR